MKQALMQSVDNHAALLKETAKKIWDFAELSLMEFQSAQYYIDILQQQGFAVETNLAGIQTAFCGCFGSGKPVIGILGEFDALSGLSQVAGGTVREEKIPGGNGHGCGHHLLGAGALGAAIAVKEHLEKTKAPGTVIFYGCPGEEGGAGKAFMAREGLWSKLDAAITWHPADANEVATGTCNSCIQKEYIFEGVASHAAGSPHMGRSGLDAVQLMNLGVEFMREHMPPSARIHYAITNAGGNSPNVVQPYARVLYMVRDIAVKDSLALQARVDNIAQGAAMMTETRLTVRFIDGTANTVPNFTLEKLMYENLVLVGAPKYTPEEWAYAKTLRASFENGGKELPGSGWKHSAEIKEFVKKATDNGTKDLNDFIMPPRHGHTFEFGSTDVGDVSWLTPTVQVYTACYPSGSPGHSWQNVACGTTEIAMKGMLTAAKAMACTALDLLEMPEILEKAKAEHKEQAAEGYACPIPPEAEPTTINKEQWQ